MAFLHNRFRCGVLCELLTDLAKDFENRQDAVLSDLSTPVKEKFSISQIHDTLGGAQPV
jgi:hypothetical protein